MFSVRIFFFKLAQGLLTLVAFTIIPVTAYNLSGSGAVVFGVWLIQLALFEGAMLYLSEKIRNWLWLAIVAASPIIMLPVIVSHFAYVALAVLPVNVIELTEEALPVIRPQINTVLKAPGVRVKTSGEIWYTKSETYESKFQGP